MKRRTLAILMTVATAAGILTGCGNSDSKTQTSLSGSADTASTESTAETETMSAPAQSGADDFDAVISGITSGPVGDENLSGEITIWNWGNYEPQGTQHFNDYYPNIKVNYVQYETADVYNKVTTALNTGGDLPDVVLMESGPRGQWMAMEDTWEVLNKAPYSVDTNQLLDFAVNLCSNEKGDLLCIQVDNCAGGWAYNRELMKKYLGTDDPDEVSEKLSTLDNIIALGSKVASGGDLVFSGNGDIWTCISGLYTQEAWVTDGKLTCDGCMPNIYDFMEKMDATGAVGDAVEWTPAWNASMADNNILFYPCPTWFVPYVLKPNDPDSTGKWGLMTPPGGGYSSGGTAYAIPKVKDEHQKELAWAWIHYMTMSQEGAKDFYEGNATPILYKPAYDTDLYNGEPDEYFGGQNVTAKFVEIAQNPNTKSRAITKYDQTISDMQAQIEQDIKDGTSADDAYAEFKKMVKQQIPEIEVK